MQFIPNMEQQTQASETGNGNSVDDPATRNRTRTERNILDNGSTTSQDPRAEGASQVNGRGTTQAVLLRRRIKWTSEMNESVIRAYFLATRNDQDKVNYRQRMYEYFVHEHPKLKHLTQQNLADRRAAILRNNLVPEPILRRIQVEISNKLEKQAQTLNTYNNTYKENTEENTKHIDQQSNEEIISVIEKQTNTNDQTNKSEQSGTSDTGTVDELTSKIKLEYIAAKIQYEGLHPFSRSNIPKPGSRINITKSIKIVNEIIMPCEIQKISKFEDIITIIYCSAISILTANGEKISRTSKNSNHERKVKAPRWHHRIERKIAEIRQELGVLTSYIKGNHSNRIRNKVNRIKNKYKIHTQYDHPNNTLKEIRDTLRSRQNGNEPSTSVKQHA